MAVRCWRCRPSGLAVALGLLTGSKSRISHFLLKNQMRGEAQLVTFIPITFLLILLLPKFKQPR